MRVIKLIAFWILLVGTTDPLFAQNPWQQDKGQILLSPYLSHYKADEYRSRNGEKLPFDNDGKFQNYNPRLYFSLPLNGYKLNLFGSLPLFANKFEDNQETQQNTDFGDLELGLRFHLAQMEQHYLMGSVTAFIPLYSNNQLPYAGYDQFGMEARLILAGNASWIGEYNNFHRMELGFRYFFPNDPAQIRLYSSQGIRLGKGFVALGELDGIFSFSDNSEFFENNLQLVADFTMLKAALNLGYEFTPKFSLYGGVFHDILNRNSGIGRGFQVFSVIRIDSK